LLVAGSQSVKNGANREDKVCANASRYCFKRQLKAAQGFLTSETLPTCVALKLS
jgi:hypothetical protein